MTATTRDAVLWGATGQALVLRECLRAASIEVVALFDNDATRRSPFEDLSVFHGRAGFERWTLTRSSLGDTGFLVAIGGERGQTRIQIYDELVASGLQALSAIHPTAVVLTSRIGGGAQILANATVCVDAQLGASVIVNTAASVDHECILGDGVHICPGARLAGCVTVGRCATVGTGAVVLPRVSIGEGAVVGAGAVVLRDVEPFDVVAGNPARVIGKRSAKEK